MRPVRTICLLAACVAAPALAQTVPSGPVSLGGDVGIFAPFSNGSGSSFTARFAADIYAWNTLGMRFTAGFANPTLGDAPDDARADMVYVTGGAIQRLAGSTYRPYVHGGVGIYHFSGDRSGTDLGVSAGAGFEVPVGLRGAVLTPELTAHVISGDGPRFSLALTVGLHTTPR